MLAIAAVIALPIFFALAGGGHGTGLILGIVLVVAGVGSGLLGARRAGAPATAAAATAAGARRRTPGRASRARAIRHVVAPDTEAIAAIHRATSHGALRSVPLPRPCAVAASHTPNVR